ncbi:bestrophin family ion channel [Reichenbachiella sp. MALMAid0571]|uniref:bestrophin family protein n=1 Tax=Reichenbachiella sp. MALMAid0571 TaxID=3143939 RepID=UPI0032DFC362
MIKYNPKTYVSHIFSVYSRHVMRALLPMMVLVGAFTASVEYVMKEIIKLEYEGTLAFHSILGIILGLFLVIRTNTAYDRWWEGRKLWGSLVNNCRTLAIKISSFTTNPEDKHFFRTQIPNLVFSMKEHLRGSIKVGEMEFPDPEMKSAVIKSKHRPNMINRIMYQRIQLLRDRGDLSQEQFFVLDKEMKAFTDIIGACERIKSTPIPYSYSMFIKKFVFFYINSLPFALVWQFGYWAVPIVVSIFYFLFSIELIAEEIEDPFGTDINDLPLDELAVKIKNAVREIIDTENYEYPVVATK